MAVATLVGGMDAARVAPTSAAALLVAVALGYLADRERRRRVESDLVVRMMRNVRLESGLSGTIEALADELLNVFDASRVLIAAQEATSERAFLWSAHRAARDAGSTLQRSTLGVTDRESYFFAAPPSWHAVRRRFRGKERFDVVAVDEKDRRLHHGLSGFISDRFTEWYPCDSLFAASFGFGADWTCRLLILDARSDSRPVEKLRLVRRLVGELGPAVYNVYLLHHLQSRAAEIERASLARGLHDGLIQALIGAEMRVHVARRQAAEKLPLVDAELSHIQEILHQEVLSVRDLMQRIKPIRVDPEELLDFLGEQVEKFERDTGVSARFFAEVRRVSLPAWTCTQLARIVQEALCNVRKHSGARAVDVRLIEDSDRWSLVIEDDGRGLRGIPASGTIRDGADARRTPLGAPSPAVIKECVRSLGGDLTLYPAPDGGLRLEITFPGCGKVQPAPLSHLKDVLFDRMPAVSRKPKSAGAPLVSKAAVGAARSTARGFVPRALSKTDRRSG